MTELKNTVRRGLAAASAVAALTLSAGACASTASTPGAGAQTLPTRSATTSSGTGSSGSDPACTVALRALQDRGQELATKLTDLPSAQAIASDLKVRFDAAATTAQSPAVKAAITTMAGDFDKLATSLAGGATGVIQNDFGKYVIDASALVKTCNA